jgi:hypothetical protein
MKPMDLVPGPGKLTELGARAGAAIRDVKRRPAPADYGWYPYDSLGLLPLVGELLEPVYGEAAGPLRRLPLADVGCGDGDLSTAAPAPGSGFPLCHGGAVRTGVRRAG